MEKHSRTLGRDTINGQNDVLWGPPVELNSYRSVHILRVLQIQAGKNLQESPMQLDRLYFSHLVVSSSVFSWKLCCAKLLFAFFSSVWSDGHGLNQIWGESQCCPAFFPNPSSFGLHLLCFFCRSLWGSLQSHRLIYTPYFLPSFHHVRAQQHSRAKPGISVWYISADGCLYYTAAGSSIWIIHSNVQISPISLFSQCEIMKHEISLHFSVKINLWTCLEDRKVSKIR